MSATRHAESGSRFRQEKYASSAALERGLMGNLVARRCQTLTRPEDLDLVWHLQLLSHAKGGLKKVADDLRAQYPERIGTASMHKFGFKAAQIYNAEKALAVEREFYRRAPDEYERMAAKIDLLDAAGPKLGQTSKAAADFLAECQHAAALDLEETLARLCLDAEIDLPTFRLWYWPELVATVREYLTASVKCGRAGAVTTGLGGKVNDALDYAFALAAENQIILIDGLARTGKTHAVKSWCARHPGRARYVQVPSSSDDIGFFRAIAQSLGVSINANSKAQQLRDRIEDTVAGGHLAMVFDEAHYAWPQSNYRQALPGRINWIMTSLANRGVPVALVTTPQFIRTQRAVEDRSAWTSAQFVGRIGHYEKLPDMLSREDLEAVARAIMPDGCARTIGVLADYAQASAKYLAAIVSAACRANYNATKAGRTQATFADVRSAIKANLLPSDYALDAALRESRKGTRARAISAPVNAPLRAIEAAPLSGRAVSPETLQEGQEFTANRLTPAQNATQELTAV